MRFFLAKWAYLLIIGILVSCNPSKNESPWPDGLEAYLAQHNAVLNLNQTDTAQTLFTSTDLVNGRVFLSGETHGTAHNFSIKLLMLKYLHARANVRFLLFEMQYDFVRELDRYVATGDEDALRRLFENGSPNATSVFCKENFELIRNIYRFNQSMPAEQRIRLIGVDIAHDDMGAVRLMKALLPATAPPVAIATLINELRQPLNSVQARSLAGRLAADISANRASYVQYLGDSWTEFQIALRSLDARYRAYDYGSDFKGFNTVREEAIYDIFILLLNNYPQGNFYGQMGSNHVMQHRFQNVEEWVAGMLQKRADSPVRGRVISIPILYRNSRMMYRADRGIEAVPEINIPSLEATAQGEATLFRLHAPGSPFFTLNAGNVFGAEGGVVTDYCQYILYIRDSPAVIPWK